jgi:catechol 2,3-dioxygenase-like lactoylglutathione lyase family enzyme
MSPPLKGVLETVLYCTSDNESEIFRFYEEVMGFRRLGPNSVAYRVGEQEHVFLLFNSEEASVQDRPPPHGATGPVHTCFVTTPESYDEWKEHVGSHGIQITQEIDWPGGQHSFYFDDPAGNVLEVADGDMWPR